MKRIFALVLLLSMPFRYANAKGNEQEEVKIVLIKDETSGDFFYEGVVPVEGVSIDEMYKKAKEWVVANFKTSDNNIQFDEKEQTIVNSGTFLIKKGGKISYFLEKGACNFKLRMWFKDGRYKFRYDNLVVFAQYNYYTTETKPYAQFDKDNKVHRHIRNEINKSISEITAQLDAAIKGKIATTSTGENW